MDDMEPIAAMKRLWDRLVFEPPKEDDLGTLLEMNTPESRELILEGLARYDDVDEEC